MSGPFPMLPPDRRGRLCCRTLEAPSLRGNLWGDPAVRDVWVYTPAGVAEEDPLPTLMVLAPYASTADMLLSRTLTRCSFAQRLDRLFADGCPAMRVVFPDVMTRLGGSQYIDAPATGNYAGFVCDDVLGALASQGVLHKPFGLMGHSSGGFGAIHLAMERPGLFAAVAAHAPDLGFDVCYLGDLARFPLGIAELGGLDNAVDAFWSLPSPSHNAFSALAVLCLSAAYADTTRDGPFPAQLPVDLATGVVQPDVLQSWCRVDPICRLGDRIACEALADLSLLYLDVGRSDEHLLHLGMDRFVAGLRHASVAHRCEFFDGGHRGNAARFDVSVPMLARALHAR